jgi:cytochrome c peroxidase
VNRVFSDAQQWTGQRTSLEDQAIKASDQSPGLLVKNLGAIPSYQEQHRKIFGTDLNPEGVAKAIAAYERTILSGNSPYDLVSTRVIRKRYRQPRSAVWLYSKERQVV